MAGLSVRSLPVAVDVMGGDYGLEVVVAGAVQAYQRYKIHSILVGDAESLDSCLAHYSNSELAGIVVKHAAQVITMEESPARAVREKADASVQVAFELVRTQQASAVVSAGNTGAVMGSGLLALGTLPGIARPAIATLIPRVGEAQPTVLLDSGANIDCHAQQLVQFALMGDAYARHALVCKQPRVALLSNGSETSKGNDVIRGAARLLEKLPTLRFVGFVEGCDISRDVADVVVCDGLVGNIVLKSMEGSVELVVESLRYAFEQSLRGCLAAWLAQPLVRELISAKLDPSGYGGAPLLGLNGVAIVCHGSSNCRAVLHAIRVARRLADEELTLNLEATLGELEEKLAESFEGSVWSGLGSRFAKSTALTGRRARRFRKQPAVSPDK